MRDSGCGPAVSVTNRIPVTHVLYLGDKPGRNPFSGAESHVLTLLEGLAQSRHDVEVLAIVWHRGPRVDARLRALEEAGVKVVRITRTWWTRFPFLRYPASLAAWWTLFWTLRARTNRVVHIHLDLIVSVVEAALAGCRHIVVSIHNDEPSYLTRRWRWWFHLIDPWIEAYIAITHHVKDYVSNSSGIDAKKISVIYYGVPEPALPPMTRAELGIPLDSYVVGFVGRLTAQKNIPLLLSAAKRLPSHFFAIVGEGDERPELEKAAKAGQLENVRFLGAVANAYRCMHAFDVFCLPSKWEGLGLVLIEAMMQHVPIIASRRGAIPEILAQGELGTLVDDSTSDGLVLALTHTRDHREEVSARAGRAAQVARERFSVRTMVAQTQNLYAEIVSIVGAIEKR